MTVYNNYKHYGAGPQPRDPPNGRAPPRPPKPVQPRDDGSHRSRSSCFAAPSRPNPNDPWPRDPGNGRQYGPQPRDDGKSSRLSSNPNPPRKPVQPRDPGSKKRFEAYPQPRDAGY